jgi:DNA-directed RNA polymerase subunit RPC12/RpoP
LEVNKSIVAIYPEARYSLIGTTAILPESLGKMVKLLKVPVVVLNMHGNYLTSPVWNLNERHCPFKADMTQIVAKREIEELRAEEINDRINKAFKYDEYTYQLENNIRITYKDRAKGLHQVLYLCPHCHAEHVMNSDGNEIWCENCGKKWVMSELGELKATEGVTEFPHIPDWYEYERQEVRKEIEAGTYHFEDQVRIESLPNAKSFIPVGEGKLTHDASGFRLESTDPSQPFTLIKEPLSLYSTHIEYNYKNKGDCIDLSTLDDTYYIYPLNRKNVVTKLHFATEEMYKIAHKQVEELKRNR